MGEGFARVLGVIVATGVVFAAGCGGGDATSEDASSSPLLTVQTTEMRFRDEIAGTVPEGVFLELHYLLANESESEVLFVQDDLRLESESGRSYAHSSAGLEAWMKESPGYHLTEGVRLVRGSHPRQWVTVFDLPVSERGNAFTIRFRDGPAVAVPGGPQAR